MVTGPQPPLIQRATRLSRVTPALHENSLPDDPADNAALSALQSFVHDGTPDGRFTSPPFVLWNPADGTHTHSHEK